MNTVTPLWDDLTAELAGFESQQLRRTLRTVQQNEGAHVHVNGQSLINFSSNNYLGMARHPAVLEAVRQVLEHWGVGATASRLISGSTVIHQDLEQALAAYMGTEAALVFPAGYLANLGLLTALAGEGDAVILDRLCHASLIDGARASKARLFVYAHNDLAEAEQALQRAASYRRRFLVTDSLFSMDGDFAPLSELAALAKRHGATGILDEAHAIGVWGEHGRGARALDARRSEWDIVVGTLSKALGSQGGFVAGPQALIDILVNKSRPFIYTTGLSAACVAAAHAALSLVQEDAAPRARVQTLAKRLRDGLQGQGFDISASESQIIPIVLGDADAALACAEHLISQGILAPAMRPPTVHAGECRIRFSVTAEHTEEDIDWLLKALTTGPLTHTLSPKGARE